VDSAAAATVATPLVEVGGVRQRYQGGAGEILVLDNVSIALRNNEIVALLGRSRCGKSTLLRIIAGLMPPTSGTVTIGGEPVNGPASQVAMVFQTFARALVVHPKVLLMDEPFSALDVLTAETLRTDLLDLWCEGRMPISSILMVTHNIEEAVLMSDRILVFSSNPGRILAELKVDLPQPRHRLDPKFRQLVDDIYAQMTARPVGKPSRDGFFPAPASRWCCRGYHRIFWRVSWKR
jgi:ABC-type nitrate/sulfonate/bicarbonate transport system ATPase subunit